MIELLGALFGLLVAIVIMLAPIVMIIQLLAKYFPVFEILSGFINYIFGVLAIGSVYMEYAIYIGILVILPVVLILSSLLKKLRRK